MGTNKAYTVYNNVPGCKYNAFMPLVGLQCIKMFFHNCVPFALSLWMEGLPLLDFAFHLDKA